MIFGKIRENPLVSVITPSFNQGKFIERTILSVLSQDYPDIEHIIVDGGSTDSTLEILGKYDDRIKWISESDKGLADAVNKGFKMAKGDILGWLNSDDTYNPKAVDTMVEYFRNNPGVVMAYGDAYFIDRDGRVTGEYPTERFSLDRFADTCFICQPAVFIRSEVFGSVGELDVNLQTCVDYDYWIRIGKYFPANRIAYIKGSYLANSRMYRENKTFSMREKVYRESMETQKKYFGSVSKSWIFGYINEIGLKKELERFENSKISVKSALKIYYAFKNFGMYQGWIYLWVWFKEGLKYLTGKAKISKNPIL